MDVVCVCVCVLIIIVKKKVKCLSLRLRGPLVSSLGSRGRTRRWNESQEPVLRVDTNRQFDSSGLHVCVERTT